MGDSKHHQKRLASPLAYPMERKTNKFTFHAEPGPRSIQEGIPLGLILREMLRHASNLKELKFILNRKHVFVDQKPRTSPRFVVGPQDVLSIPGIHEHYRLIHWVGRRGLKLVQIPEEDSNWKLVSIVDKTTVRGGHIQLNLDDGRNILLRKDAVSDEDPFTDPATFATRGTLKIELPSQKILEYFPFELDSYALITSGTNTGLHGFLRYTEKRVGKNRSVAIIESGEDQIITAMENVFIIGKDAPEVPVFQPEDEGSEVEEEEES